MEIMHMKDMARLLEHVPAPDPEMEERCYNEYIRNGYIIYDGRKNKAVCTRCGYEWDLYPKEYSRLHGLKETCPCCAQENILLAAGRGRQRYTEYFRVLSFAEHQGAIYAFLNNVVATFENFGRPTLNRTLTNIYIISKHEQKRWRLYEGWYGDRYYENIRSMSVPAPPRGMGWYSYSKYEDFVYTDGLMDMLVRSDCKHLINMPLLVKNRGHDIIPFLATCMKYHSVEMLAKAGFESIAQMKIHGFGCRAINWRAESLEKILKLPKRWIRKLRPYDPNMAQLEAFQKLPEIYKDRIPIFVLKDAISYNGTKCPESYIEEVEKYMPFDKWLRWAASQESYDESKYSPNLLRDYKDYIRTAEKLGMDIHKKSTLRPADLKQAHDEAVNRLRVETNAAIDRLIAENCRTDEFRTGSLMIVPAICQEDLNKESAKLHHCVKTYGEKLASGRCYIFFVREVSNPTEPYYTLETKSDGTFVQCRGLMNCGMTAEVKMFTDAFVKSLKAGIKKEREEACQTA